MKRFLTVSLIMAFLLGSMVTSAFAASTELLTNPGFESGNNGWVGKSGATLATTTEAHHSGSACAKVTNRKTYYATCEQNITAILKEKGQGLYNMSLYARLVSAASSGAGYAVISIQDSAGNHWFTTPQKTLSTSWTQFSGTVCIAWTGTLTSATIYFQNQNNDQLGDLYFDDFSLTYSNAATDEYSQYAGNVTTVSDGGKATLGAIRWDAWYGHDGKSASVVSQVEKSLGPSYYHWRAPFYSTVQKNGGLWINSYTQSVFDQEMCYAINAGVDYFGFVWYDTDMKASRNFYLSSKYREQIKMCTIFDGNSIGQDACYQQVKTMISQDYWVKVCGGRPLMYYFCGGSNMTLVAQDILKYRAMCASLKIPYPYVVLLGASEAMAKVLYADAVSSYAVGGSGLTYPALAKKAEDIWAATGSTDIGYVPNVTAGWNPKPRYENPVTWTTVADGNWCDYGTAKEIAGHLKNGYTFLSDQKNAYKTQANTMLLYAWNENDEGGWICPTLAVDDKGNQLFDATGAAKADTSRLDAVEQVIETYKGHACSVQDPATYTPSPTQKPGSTPAPGATPVPGTSPTNGTALETENGDTSAPTVLPGTTDVTATTDKTPSATDSGKKEGSGWQGWVIAGAIVLVVVSGGVAAYILWKKKKQ